MRRKPRQLFLKLFLALAFPAAVLGQTVIEDIVIEGAKNSVERDAADNNIQLVNDAASPGNDVFYGTNGSGVRGWYTPAGSGHADGANCAAGEIALGVDAAGAVQGCYEPVEADITDLSHTADTNLTDEEVEDIIGAALVGVETRISVSYDDVNGEYDFVVDDMNDVEVNNLGAAVTWANIPDGNVPESAVTQHEAALTITESQISDLDHLDETGTETITGNWTFNDLGTGDLTDYDIEIGDTDGSPTYGVARLGNSTIGRMSYNVGNLDLDGTVLIRNVGAPATSNIEFAFAESGNAIRFAIPASGVGNATYNPRSMFLAGPAVLDDTVVTLGYWQGVGLFDNIDADTSGTGADLGIQDDLEVEGQIFVDDIDESTAAAGVTIDGLLVKDSGIPAAAVTAHEAAIDHDQLTNFTSTEHFVQGAISIPASQVSDFDTEVSNNASVAANTAKTTNATHTGDVTGATALTIAVDAVDIAMLSATGTPSGSTYLRGDNTWSTPAGGGGIDAKPCAFDYSASHNITTTESTIPFDNEIFDPDSNCSNSSGEIDITDAGYYQVSVNVPVNDDGSGGATRGRVWVFLQKDAGTGTWTTVNQIRGQVYEREASGGTGLHAAGIVSLVANEDVRVRVDVSSSVDVSTESGEASINIHRIR